MVIINVVSMFNFTIKKWQQNEKYFARINFSNSNNKLKFLVESENKTDFNEKILNLIKNCLVLRN